MGKCPRGVKCTKKNTPRHRGVKSYNFAVITEKFYKSLVKRVPFSLGVAKKIEKPVRAEISRADYCLKKK